MNLFDVVKELLSKDDEAFMRDFMLASFMRLMKLKSTGQLTRQHIDESKVLEAETARDISLRNRLEQFFSEQNEKLIEVLQAHDANGLSLAFILKALAWNKSFEWLKTKNLISYSPKDGEIAKRLGFDSAASCIFETHNLFELAALFFPNEYETLFNYPKPEHVSVKRMGSNQIQQIPIAEFERLTGITSFENALRIPKGLNSFLPINPSSNAQNISLDAPFYFQENPPPLGWVVRVFDAKLLPDAIPYTGIIVSRTRDSDYVDTNIEHGIEHLHGIDAQHNRGIAGFFTHLPSVEDLGNNYALHPILRGNVATGSARSMKNINGYNAIFYSTQGLADHALVGFNYGIEYFESRQCLPMHFDNKLGITVPTALCHPKEFLLKMDINGVCKQYRFNLENVWQKIKLNEAIRLTSITGEVTSFAAEQIRAALERIHAFPKFTSTYQQANFNANNALKDAIIAGDMDAVWYLLDFYEPKIDINADLGLQNTALHYAVLYGCLDVMLFLFARGANIKLKNADDKTALELIPAASMAADGQKDISKFNAMNELFRRAFRLSQTATTSTTSAAITTTTEAMIAERGRIFSRPGNDSRRPPDRASTESSARGKSNNFSRR